MEKKMNKIEITATLSKTNIDAKKATVTFELEYESYNQIPNIARMTGQVVDVIVYPAQSSMDLD